MVVKSIEAVIQKISDPAVQKRAVEASKNAMIMQLSKDGVVITPELLSELATRQATAKDDASAALLGVIIGFSLSDARLKTNIERVGTSILGINIYEFSYKGSEDRWQGVLAQELVERFPSAISTNKVGFLMVDYDKIDVEFVRIVH